MRTLLHQKIADALRRGETETRGGLPQWCFEVDRIGATAAVDALDAEFRGWGRDILFASFEIGKTYRTAAVSMDELRRIIVGAVRSGGVIAVMDGTILGGCKFDFSNRNEDTFELLVTCWGSKESVADRLVEKFPDGHTFRGN